MENSRILGDGYPTPDQVREWGYDEDLLLWEQDEDLWNTWHRQYRSGSTSM